jgi:hypothetical protein
MPAPLGQQITKLDLKRLHSLRKKLANIPHRKREAQLAQELCYLLALSDSTIVSRVTKKR